QARREAQARAKREPGRAQPQEKRAASTKGAGIKEMTVIARRTRRRITNIVMFAITGACTLLAVSVLFFILGYLLWQGGHTLNLDFFTKLPAPVGETGGGFANAILGSAKLLVMASLIGIPIGFLGGVYLAEFGGTTPAFVVRYTTDLLNGVPS